MGNTDSNHRDGGVLKKEKLDRLSPSPEETILPQGSPEGPVYADTTTILPSEFSELRGEPITFQQAVTMSQTRISSLHLPTQPTTKLPSMFNGSTRPNPTKAEVDMMLASFQQPSEYQISSTVLHHAPSTSPLPLDSSVVSSTTLDFFLPTSQEANKLLLNDNIMWGGGSSAVTVDSSSVPVQYLETNEQGFINLEDIEYDYLYPATVDPANVQPLQTAGGGERLLSFSML